MNVEKLLVMRISRQQSPTQIIIDENKRRIWNISTVWVA
jgi:hypothetical protein